MSGIDSSSRPWLALAVVALVAISWFAFGHFADPIALPPGVGASSNSDPANAQVEVEKAAPREIGAQRVEGPEPEPAARRMTTLRGRCVDEYRRPIEGCEVSLDGSTDKATKARWLAQHGAALEWQRPPAITTAADGLFSFTVWAPPPFRCSIRITSPVYGGRIRSWDVLPDVGVVEVGDVVLHFGVRVTGSVVDTKGRPQEAVKLHLSLRGRQVGDDAFRPDWGVDVTSEAHGAFATSVALVPGSYMVSATPLACVAPKEVILPGASATSGATVQVRVVVETPPMSIRGRVLDLDGAPASNVVIEDIAVVAQRRTTTSREDGSFELQKPEGDDALPARLRLHSVDYEVGADSSTRGLVLEVAWGRDDVEFRVRQASKLTLCITDEKQAPVDFYSVRLMAIERSYAGESKYGQLRAEGRHANGSVVLPGLTRGAWYLIVDFRESAGLATIRHRFHHDTDAPLRLELEARASVRRIVRVVTYDGTPVAGTKVQVCETFGAPMGTRTVMNENNWRGNGASHGLLLLLREGETDGEGCFEVGGARDHNVGLCVLGPGHLPLRVDGVQLRGPGDFVVQVKQGGTWTGRIVPPEAWLEFQRLAGVEPGKAFPNDSRPRLILSDARGLPLHHTKWTINDDGSFDVRGLPAGTWNVTVQASNSGIGWRDYSADHASIVEGRTTKHDLDFTHILPGTIEVTVLVNGQPYAHGIVTLHCEGMWLNFTTDSEGRFSYRGAPGEYHFLVQKVTHRQSALTLRSEATLRIVRGRTTKRSVALASSTLRLRVLDRWSRRPWRTVFCAQGS